MEHKTKAEADRDAGQVKAEARYIRVSAQKARLVVDMIRGQKAGAAITTLRTVNKRIAPTVEKVLQSAIANATIATKTWMWTSCTCPKPS